MMVSRQTLYNLPLHFRNRIKSAQSESDVHVLRSIPRLEPQFCELSHPTLLASPI